MDCAENDKVGIPGAPSTYRDAAVTADTGPVLPATSLTLFAANSSTNVPSPHPATVTLTETPDVEDGVITQFCAVPVLEKSPAAIPVTD